MIRSACDAAASAASTASSEGSRLTAAGSGGGSMISAKRRRSSSVRWGSGVGAGQDLLESRTIHDFGEFGHQARTADQIESTRADLLNQRMRFLAPKQAGQQHIPDSSTLVSATLAGRRRSARAAFTSLSISPIDIGSIPASATRSAIAKSASAARRRLIASVSSRSSAYDVRSPASRAERAVASDSSICTFVMLPPSKCGA